MTTCPWDIDLTECARGLSIDPDSPDGALLIEQATLQVSEMLSRWSGYRYGGCRTLRPLEPCGSCRDTSCCLGDCIILHDASSVTEVRVNGEVLDPTFYAYDPARQMLCAMPGYRWPTSDPRTSPVPALEVDVVIGSAPDTWALSVAAELACEILTSAQGGQCRLPRNATSISSQGIVVTLSPDELVYSMPSVISWVNSVNPHRATSPARVLSPEAKRRSSPRRPWARF